MRLIADENMPLIEELFSPFCVVKTFPGREIDAAKIAAADILLIRSVTQVDGHLLNNSQIKFVGSATIGLDHIDTDLLDRMGVKWAYAPGCNARAVGEYVVTVLLSYLLEKQVAASACTLGIVGYGNTGAWVAKLATVLGFNIVVCDPYKEVSNYPNVKIDTLLQSVDMVSFHTPLTTTGRFPTWHLGNMERLSQLKTGALIINASRGSVLDFSALKAVLVKRSDLQIVLDVWEPEPMFPSEMLPYVRLATPHIAGYSQEGKARGTEMLFFSCAEFFGWDIKAKSKTTLVSIPYPECVNTLEDLLRLLLHACPLERDDAMMRELSNDTPEVRAQGFDRLRKEYPPRHEFWRYAVTSQHQEMLETLRLLGFDVQG